MTHAKMVTSDLLMEVIMDSVEEEWRSVLMVFGELCDSGWDVRDATTVCRQLGLPVLTCCLFSIA